MYSNSTCHIILITDYNNAKKKTKQKNTPKNYEKQQISPFSMQKQCFDAISKLKCHNTYGYYTFNQVLSNTIYASI
jgi:hypothetical protein